jgi:homoserine kinase type II
MRRRQIFMDAYQSVRKFTPQELAAMPVLLRGAAMRFLITRLFDWFNTPQNALVKKKDPMEYLKKLEFLSAS